MSVEVPEEAFTEIGMLTFYTSITRGDTEIHTMTLKQGLGKNANTAIGFVFVGGNAR